MTDIDNLTEASASRARGRPKGTTKGGPTDRIRSRYFRLVLPDLQDYLDPKALNRLKGDTLQLLLSKQTPRGLQYYCIAAQTHPTTGVPHLDILLCYGSSIKTTLTRFDYLIKHGSLTRYRSLNSSILQYGKKQDASPLTNLPSSTDDVLLRKRLQSQPYAVLQQAMYRNPFHFDPFVFLRAHSLTHTVSRVAWSKHISLLRNVQQSYCNQLLATRRGFRQITRELIQSSLSEDQLRIYDSWQGYQTIVDHLNQVPRWGGQRPSGTPNLMIVSAESGIGKTSLFQDQNPAHFSQPISDLSAVYIMGMKHWFPKYRSGTYQLILWNQAKLTSYPYDTILKVLEGFPVDLPYHGGATKKDDNPLVVMTSNLPLQRHICIKFTNREDREYARRNLGRRITEVRVPDGLSMFLLQRLIHPL